MVGPLFGTHGYGEVHGTSMFNSLNNDVSNDLDLIYAVDIWSTTEMPLLNTLVSMQCAMLPIQASPLDSDACSSFDYTTGSWSSGTTVLPPRSMTMETTVGSKITYGYNWNRGTISHGQYCLNFYFNPKCTGCCMQILDDQMVVIN